jgi:hypothetical protein
VRRMHGAATHARQCQEEKSGVAHNEVYMDSCRNRRKAISAAWHEVRKQIREFVSIRTKIKHMIIFVSNDVVIWVTYYKYPSLVRKVPATEHSSNDFLLRFASNIHFALVLCRVKYLPASRYRAFFWQSILSISLTDC